MKISFPAIFLFSIFSFLPYLVEEASAHCDAMDGPVIKAAQEALRTSNINLVLSWVKEDDDKEVRQAFTQTLEVRKLNPAAKDLADRYFFETLVRIHRAGEGFGYTGIKPAGQDIGPAVPAADKAIESGSAEGVVALLTEAVKHGVPEHFEKVTHSKDYDRNNVKAGREYVEQYVKWVHYVNGIYQAAAGKKEEHTAEEGAHGHMD